MNIRNISSAALVLIFLLLQYGCGGGSQMTQKIDSEPKQEEQNYAIVKTYFGTDRNEVLSDNDEVEFGEKRAKLKYGFCNVSIPRDHKMGELESPSIVRLEFKEDPEKHVVVLNKSTLVNKSFIDSINWGLKSTMDDNVFVFVHGYNVSFNEAARRTAQMSYDLGFKGIPIFYSWPSQGETAQYTIDRQNIEWSTNNIRNFISDITNRVQCTNIYLIAHSMGNLGLTKAIASLPSDTNNTYNKIKEIILTAPDIDAEIFKRDIAPKITERFDNVTLYASSEDLALKASKVVNGHPRAGDSGQGLLVVESIETIDATGMDTGFLKHSYFAETHSMLADIYELINKGKRAEDRFGLEEQVLNTGTYWRFKTEPLTQSEPEPESETNCILKFFKNL